MARALLIMVQACLVYAAGGKHLRRLAIHSFTVGLQYTRVIQPAYTARANQAAARARTGGRDDSARKVTRESRAIWYKHVHLTALETSNCSVVPHNCSGLVKCGASTPAACTTSSRHS